MPKPVFQFAFDPKPKDPIEKNKPVFQFAFDPKIQDPAEEKESEPTPVVPFELVEIREGLFELRGAPTYLRDGILPAVKVIKLGDRKNTPLQGVKGCFTNT